MEDQKDRNSDEPEDIPSDFFDDFTKDEFIEGLSVIDSWDDNGQKKRKSRYDAETLESVNDLRELIGDGKEEGNEATHREKSLGESASSTRRCPATNSHLDDYIKPGSRRDPSKTNAAIRKDKEVKVKQLLAKQLESTDDLRPPGTELDDYLSGGNPETRPRQIKVEPLPQPSRGRSRSRERRKESTRRRSPRRSPHRSPHRSMRRSPFRGRRSPYGHQQRRPRSPRHFSPPRRRIREQSPRYRHSPPRRSPMRRSPRRERRSISGRRSVDLSPALDNFLYPMESRLPTPFVPSGYPMGMGPPGMFMGPGPVDYPGPAYPYPSGPGYPDSFGIPYEYSGPPVPVMPPLPMPQPVPAPMIVPAPVIVPSVSQITPSISSSPSERSTPFDALAQLVAEGKLSKEDYLKLTPNKGAITATSTHTKDRIEVLNRCHQALQQLGKLRIPSKLVMGNMVINEPKALGAGYCSPLKRSTAVEFLYTKKDASATVQHNKHIIDTIINVIGLNHVVAAPKRKAPKNMRDSATQTTKPFCDVCAIRDSTRLYDTATATEPEHFSCSVHTQVVEQELINSKAVFNPSGSVADGAPISIAHLTPAQLVSQLAARAKTLKQTEPMPPFERRGQFDYEGRGGGSGGQQYHNNYRY